MPGHEPFIIGGNWKMNGSLDLVNMLSSSLNSIEENNKHVLSSSSIKVIIFPPAPLLLPVKQKFPSWISVGAQDISTKHGQGAYTGEISNVILESLQVEWVIVGHSERRQHFNEDEKILKGKIKSCFDANINVIYCIGESLKTRESNQTYEYLDNQLMSVLVSVLKGNESKIVIAYEPIWAIGTGMVAKPHQIQEAFKHIRNWLKTFSPLCEHVPIIYGGSVNAKNCQELASIPGLGGFLVGGASISSDFSNIITHSLAQVE